jgi:hypothetical protein
MSELKFCIDCKHCKVSNLIPFIGPKHYYCTHPALKRYDKVSGKIKLNYHSCDFMRSSIGSCSTRALMWEKK